MITFIDYLQERKLAESSQVRYLNSLGKALTFFNQPDPRQIQVADLHHYIKYLLAQKRSKRYINEELRAIRHYFTYLERQGKIDENPSQNLYLKGVPRTLVKDLLSLEELEELERQYQVAYPDDGYRQAVLSLMIHQGLATADFKLLRAEQIQVPEGKIYLMGSAKTQGRVLKLKGSQILLLKSFLESRSTFLFLFGDLTNKLSYTFKKQFPKLPEPASRIKNAAQIRASVITHWLKLHDIRDVQYWAGHKYISTTENYQKMDMSSLQEDVKKYHPR